MFLLWIGLAALFVFIGWGIQVKKWYFLISGYNMMSKEEQAKVNIEPLAKSLGIMAYMMAALLILMGISIHFELGILTMIITGLMIVVPLVFVIKGQKHYKEGSLASSNKKSKKISIIITIATLLFVGIIFYFSMQPTKFEVSDSHFSISGMYGDDYAWDTISQLELVEELPAIAVRTNGSAVGSKLKGHFKFKNGDKATLFLDKSVPSFIRIEVEGKVVFLNEPSKEKTEDLFHILQQQVQ